MCISFYFIFVYFIVYYENSTDKERDKIAVFIGNQFNKFTPKVTPPMYKIKFLTVKTMHGFDRSVICVEVNKGIDPLYGNNRGVSTLIIIINIQQFI